jgi:DNA-binding MarR family transcriptional regulator
MHDSNVLGAWLLAGADRIREAVASVGVAERDLAALVLIDTHPGRGIDWLFRRLGLTQSGSVRLVDRLAALGLVERSGAGGRGGVRLEVTDAGRNVLADGLRARDRAIAELTSAFDPGERDQLAALAHKALTSRRRERVEADIACRLCDWPVCGAPCPVDDSVDDGDDDPGVP